MMRRLTTCFAALALVLAGCGDDDDAAVPASGEDTTTTVEDPTTTSTTDPTTSSTTTSTTEPGGVDDVALEQSCESPDGFTISHPGDWEAVGDCGQFGPAPLEEPEPNTDERTGVISAFVDPVPYEQVAEPTEGDRDRREETVDGRTAVRVAGQQSGTGLYPEGTDYVRWIVDVSDDGEPATLFIDAYDLGYDIDFDRAVTVLDAMAASVELSDR